MSTDVLERVRKIVIEHLDADPEKVTEKASFIDDLGADSLDNVELVMAFEEEFDIEIPDDAAEHIAEARVSSVADVRRQPHPLPSFAPTAPSAGGSGRRMAEGQRIACVASSSPESDWSPR